MSGRDCSVGKDGLRPLSKEPRASRGVLVGDGALRGCSVKESRFASMDWVVGLLHNRQ